MFDPQTIKNLIKHVFDVKHKETFYPAGKKHELKVGDMTITRRCYYSEWDLIRYKDVVTNELALQWKINVS